MSLNIDSPVSLLARFLSRDETSSGLILLTGESGAGKTRWCQELIRMTRLSDLSPQGLVSPAVFESGLKTGIDAVAIHSGERRRLATWVKSSEHGSQEHPKTHQWKFDLHVLEWADRVLSELAGGDLLVLDELGPLEFYEGTGFISGMELVDSRSFQLTIAVIRPALLSRAQARWPWGQMLDVSTLRRIPAGAA